MAATLEGYDPVTIQPWLERVIVAMTIFALCTTCLRIYSRRLNHQDLWWDDYLAIFSMVCTRFLVLVLSSTEESFNIAQSWLLIDVVLISVDVSLGLGRHSDNLSKAAVVTMVKITLAIDTVYSTSCGSETRSSCPSRMSLEQTRPVQHRVAMEPHYLSRLAGTPRDDSSYPDCLNFPSFAIQRAILTLEKFGTWSAASSAFSSSTTVCSASGISSKRAAVLALS